MTESEYRIQIAKNTNDIFRRVFKNISNSQFNPNINFDNIPSGTLKDFWLYTSGFIGIKNQEEFDHLLTNKEVIDILSGNFILKELSIDQAQNFAMTAKKKLPPKGNNLKIDLYTIQDGTYSILKGVKDENGQPHNYLTLKTNPLEFHTDKSPTELNLKPKDILKSLRNVFAHRIPFIQDKTLIFERGEDEIVVSKMWLRGFSELFAKMSNQTKQLDDQHLSLNPTIIYNLQQLASIELNNRGELSGLTTEDLNLNKVHELLKQVDQINIRMNQTSVLISMGQHYSKMAENRLRQEIRNVKSRIHDFLTGLSYKQKLETSNMELYNPEDLKNHPKEVAFNLIVLMCYNSLVTSAFYDDLISKTTIKDLNTQQETFFNKFNINKLSVYYDGNKSYLNKAKDKIFTFLCLRESLFHGNISCSYQPNRSTKDMIITFSTDDRQKTTISGTVQDFFDLFSSPLFTTKRSSEIITNKNPSFIPENEESLLDFESTQQLIQNLKDIEENLYL